MNETHLHISQMQLLIQGRKESYSFEQIFEQFETLGCKHFQLRCFAKKPISYFEYILKALDKRRILSVEFIIKSSEETSFENLKKLADKYPRVHSFIVYSAN